MTATCRLCDGRAIGILNLTDIIGDEQAKSLELGKAMLIHMQTYHPKYVRQLVIESRLFNGFLIMNRFIIDSEDIEDEKENMRDRLADKIMEDAPEMDDDDDDEEDDDNVYDDNEESDDYIMPSDPSRPELKEVDTIKEVIDITKVDS